MKQFLLFVEFRAKVASFFPFLIGTLFAVYSGARLDVPNMALMLASLLCIDMATTGLNHYKDYKKAILKEGYHYEVHNPMGQGAVTVRNARWILTALLATGTACGIALSVRTDVLVLIFGMCSFGIGILYSAGPIPLSRTVLGEAFSGSFMGGIIPFLSYYIHVYSSRPVRFIFADGELSASLRLSGVVPILWTGLPLMFLIASIMLANNICDVKEDFINRRYTLPVSMGVERSILLFQALNILSVFSVLLGAALQIIPVYLLVVALGVPVLYRQTMLFSKNPSKDVTFVNAVKNFVLTAVLMVIGLVAGIMVPIVIRSLQSA